MAETVERKAWWKIAAVAVIAIEAAGGASGWLSNSGYGNGWFASLQKPLFMPPGWTVRRGLADPLRAHGHFAVDGARGTAVATA